MLDRPTPAPIPPQDVLYGLDIDAAERETLLAPLEIAQALAGGDVAGARFLATATCSGPILEARVSGARRSRLPPRHPAQGASPYSGGHGTREGLASLRKKRRKRRGKVREHLAPALAPVDQTERNP